MIVTIILDGDGDNVGRFNGWVGVPRALIQRRHQFATDLFQKGEVGGRQAARDFEIGLFSTYRLRGTSASTTFTSTRVSSSGASLRCRKFEARS